MYSTVPPCVCGLKHDSTQTCDSPEPLSMLLLFFQIFMANYLMNLFKSGQFWLLSFFCGSGSGLWFKEVGVKFFDVLMCYDSPKMLQKDVNKILNIS